MQLMWVGNNSLLRWWFRRQSFYLITNQSQLHSSLALSSDNNHWLINVAGMSVYLHLSPLVRFLYQEQIPYQFQFRLFPVRNTATVAPPSKHLVSGTVYPLNSVAYPEGGGQGVMPPPQTDDRLKKSCKSIAVVVTQGFDVGND